MRGDAWKKNLALCLKKEKVRFSCFRNFFSVLLTMGAVFKKPVGNMTVAEFFIALIIVSFLFSLLLMLIAYIAGWTISKVEGSTGGSTSGKSYGQYGQSSMYPQTSSVSYR